MINGVINPYNYCIFDPVFDIKSEYFLLNTLPNYAESYFIRLTCLVSVQLNF